MLSQERIFQGIAQTLITLILTVFIALFVTGCGGGGGSNAGVPDPTTPPQTTGALVLKADAGAMCETLLAGEVYSITIPTLSCNKGTDPYIAYLDGSKSTTADGQAPTYAWSFVSVPQGSQATLTGANTVKPTFVPDKPGAYIVQLVVSSQGVSSPRAVTLVVALDNATLTRNPNFDPSAKPYVFHGGLSSNCSVCHTIDFPTISQKPSTHIATSNMCQTCHTPAGFARIGFVDHDEIFGNCSDCHNNVTAIGKSATHIVTTQECSDCHTTISFLTLAGDGTFNHANITEPCSACHNGVVAKGTEADTSVTGHPSISVECNSCHTTTTFAAPFLNHSDPKIVVPGTCGQAGCHDGSSTMSNGMAIIGKNSAPNPHPATGNITQACDLCHNTTSYNLHGVFDHSVLARHPIACSSCHDGLNATGKTTNHIFTSQASDCSNCHNTTTFTGGFVDHLTDPSVIGAGIQCTACHDGTHERTIIDANGNSITLPIPGKPNDLIHATFDLSTDCSTCHTAGGSFTLATIDHSSFGTIAAPNTSIVCTNCHDGAIATGKTPNHLQTSQQCYVCHEPQSDTFAHGIYDHSTVSISGVTSTPSCASCHNGSPTVGRSLTHVPTTGQDCLICHGTGFTSFALPVFDHSAAAIISNCVSCHDGHAHDGVIVISKPTGHIPTTDDCSKCHADTNNGPGINGTALSGFSTALPFVNTVHPAYTTGCRTCHNGAYDNSIYLARKHPADSVHNVVDTNGWECNACHTTTGNFMETNPVNHQDPVIKSQTCVSCHVAGNTVQPIGKSGAHPTTSNECQHCHQAGGSFTAGFDHATLNTGGANQGLACNTCHNGVNATGKTQNHVPTTRDCYICHAAYPPAASSFVGGTFDHNGPEMSGKLCMNCHDGKIATGKTPTHLVTTLDCAGCHTTDSFANVTSFNHTGVVSGCQNSGCHNSGNPTVTDVTDDPNPKPHIPISNGGTEVDCINCHKNPGGTFANATMNHTVVTFVACQSCHDGNHDGSNTAHIVTTKSSSHLVTSITACASCHTSTTSWTAITYKHVTNGGYPGDHNINKVTSCTQCHNNTPANANISTFPHTTYGSTCAACHASQGTREHGNPLPSKYYNCGNSGCHQVSSSSF